MAAKHRRREGTIQRMDRDNKRGRDGVERERKEKERNGAFPLLPTLI